MFPTAYCTTPKKRPAKASMGGLMSTLERETYLLELLPLFPLVQVEEQISAM